MSEVATHLVIVPVATGSNLFVYFFWEHLESSLITTFSTTAFMTHSTEQIMNDIFIHTFLCGFSQPYFLSLMPLLA